MAAKKGLSHVGPDGRSRMVDVGAKAETARVAVAEAVVRMRPATLRLILAETLPKGGAIEVARLAAFQAVKRTPDLIPMCHPIRITGTEVRIAPIDKAAIRIEVEVRAHDRTGAEMEAMTGASVAALAIYDMAKAVEPTIEIASVRLLAKSGGKSGTWKRDS